jgi:RNA polymerase sigma-70 factor (ECF subfamily)
MGSVEGFCMVGVGNRRQRESADEALIRALYNEHGGAMLAYAIRLTGDRGAAEDVVQEALLRAWRHSEKLVAERGSIRGWLLTVVRNLVTDRARARNARPAEVADVTEVHAPAATERDHSDQVVAALVVGDALARLPADQRAVIVEVYLRGRTVSEVAAGLGIPAGTVKSRCFYGLRTLRDMFVERQVLTEGVT